MNLCDTKSFCARKLELNVFNINQNFYITSPMSPILFSFFVRFAVLCFVELEAVFTL